MTVAEVEPIVRLARDADFLNTCLRELGLDHAQVDVSDLRPGIDALYYALRRKEDVLARKDEALSLLLDIANPAHRTPGVNPDGSVSTLTMAQTLGHAALEERARSR